MVLSPLLMSLQKLCEQLKDIPEFQSCCNMHEAAHTCFKHSLTWPYMQIDTQTMPPGDNNPYDIGFFHTEKELVTEKGAIRDIDTTKSRVWKIKNPSVTNPKTGVMA